MGSGCLSPKPLEGDLINSLIDELHSTSSELSKDSLYLQQSSDYQSRKQKLYKKSPLRKLIDHLSSHRTKISEALNYNLKVTVQKGGVVAWTTGLIVLERITSMAKGSTHRIRVGEKLEAVLRNRCPNSSWGQSESLPTEYPTLAVSTQKENTGSSMAQKSLTGSSADLVLQEILSAKFESTFLNTLSSCLQEQELYGQGLRVLRQYSQLSAGHFKTEEKIGQVLRLLIDNVRAGYQRLISLESYYSLITKMKEKSVLELFQTHKQLAKLWIHLQGKAMSTTSIPQAHKHQQEITFIELILGRFLVCALDAMQYKTAITLLMEVNDESSFEWAEKLESFYVAVLRSNDLGLHLLKGLILQILRYGVMGGVAGTLQAEGEVGQLVGQAGQQDYRNLRDSRTRANLYRTIRRWVIERHYILLEEIVKYHSSLFIYCFLLTLPQELKSSASSPQGVFREIIRCISSQEKLILVETVLEEYQKEGTSQRIRWMLLSMNQYILSQLSPVILEHNLSRFTINTTGLNSEQVAELYRALMTYYRLFKPQTLELYKQQLCELLASVCGYFNTDERSGEMEGMVDEVVEFIDAIIQIDGIAVAYYQKITKIVHRKQSRMEECDYFKALQQRLLALFRKHNITKYEEEEEEEKEEGVGEVWEEGMHSSQAVNSCQGYFKELLGWEGGSKLDGRSCHFEKQASIVSERMQGEEQASFQDVLDMINL